MTHPTGAAKVTGGCATIGHPHRSLGVGPPTALAAAFVARATTEHPHRWTRHPAPIQPFWILPVLAISKLHLRDVMGYLVLVLVFLGVLFGGAMLAWGYLAA